MLCLNPIEILNTGSLPRKKGENRVIFAGLKPRIGLRSRRFEGSLRSMTYGRSCHSLFQE